ncbi:MAG TPA: hypothetical protein VLX11_12145 [Candidatus Acidoferrales bacterium]|nr:hypothetical protein [Candidatus Acidoferrales bacterium]
MKKYITASFLASLTLIMLLPVARQVNAVSVNRSIMRQGGVPIPTSGGGQFQGGVPIPTSGGGQFQGGVPIPTSGGGQFQGGVPIPTSGGGQ